MKRFSIFLLAATLAFSLWLTPAPADAGTDFTAPIVANLKAEGYELVEIRRTWLGRILIVSRNGTYLREIVLNRRTGEILRDKLFPDDTAEAMPEGKAEAGDSPDAPGPTGGDDTPKPGGAMGTPPGGGNMGSGGAGGNMGNMNGSQRGGN